MTKHSGVFKEFVTFDNLYGGYLLARKNKRYKQEVLEYTANLEENIINAQNHLMWKSYKVDGMSEFIEYFPKKRIITVMPFKNRVVNCAAYNVLFPIYRRSFYEHSYGSIPGRGPIKAADKLQQWLRIVKNKPEKWYICKMDIAKFFFRIPLEVQLRELGKPLDDPEMMWFLEQAIICDGRPFGLPVDADNVTDCQRILGVGMQVGSLISQMTANVVMTSADNYIKRVLRAPYYIRYMDDMVFLAPSKAQAQDILGKFSEFLKENLGLELNSKTAIMPEDIPVEFVGKMISSEKIRLRKSTTLRMKRHLKYIMDHYTTGEVSMEYALAVLQSYMGFMSHVDSGALRAKIAEDWVLVRHYDEDFDEEQIFYPD